MVNGNTLIALDYSKNKVMKKVFILAALSLLVIVFTSFGSRQIAGTRITAFNDSLEQDRAKYIAIVTEKIKGKEKLPADSVFKNLKMLNRMPAARLLAIMN